MSSSTTASNLAGMWFGELASALRQGTWHEMAAGHGAEQPPLRRQQQLQHKLGGDLGEKNQTMTVEGMATAAGGGRKAAQEDVARCGGAMSDTTVCLLLDRFVPS